METRSDEPEEGRREQATETNVVRLRDWLAPPEEFVPLGAATRRADARRESPDLRADHGLRPESSSSSEGRLTGPRTTGPVRASDFWGEGSAAIHDALEAPAACGGRSLGGVRDARPSSEVKPSPGVCPPARRRRRSLPRSRQLRRAAIASSRYVVDRVSDRLAPIAVARLALVALGVLVGAGALTLLLTAARPAKRTVAHARQSMRVPGPRSSLVAGMPTTLGASYPARWRASTPTVAEHATPSVDHSTRRAAASRPVAVVNRSPTGAPPVTAAYTSAASAPVPPATPAAPRQVQSVSATPIASSPASVVTPVRPVEQPPSQAAPSPPSSPSTSGPAFGATGALGPGGSPDS